MEQAIAPYEKERFQVSGPEARLPSRVALALSMALHELATKCSKVWLSRDVEWHGLNYLAILQYLTPRIVELRWEGEWWPAGQ